MFKTRLLPALLALCLVASLVACAQPSAPSDSTPAAQPNEASPAPSDVSAAPSAEPAPADWATANRINDGSQTPEELYELAKEEGTVVLYSISSRCGKVKESFEAQYPGVICDAYDISTNELLEKITREYDAGIRNADVVHIKDQDGSIYRELVLNGKFHNYYPDDICAHIDPDMMKYFLPMYVEMCYLYYNEEIYSESPVDSWWDLTRPEWKGKVILTSPLDNISYMAQFTAFTQNADALAADYEREFGEPIVLDGTKNAGYELIKRLAANDLIFASSSDEIVEAVGTRGQKSAPIGYGSSVKMRNKEDKNWALGVDYDFLPASGVPAVNALYIVDEAPHPNAAKLLIRWIMGEADGKGEGFAPFNTLGGWPIRDDVELAPGSTPLSEINMFELDVEYIYENAPDVGDFWLSLMQ